MSIDLPRMRILHYPAKVLREKTQPVERVDQTVRDVAARMLELMHEVKGLGLAAPQVGLSWRMFVANSASEDEPDRVYINPRLSNLGGEMTLHEEGCLSLPKITAEIRRPSMATIIATDLDGNEFTMSAEGMLARVWQHEHDHLEGVLIIDRMSPIDRLATKRALKQMEAAATPATSDLTKGKSRLGGNAEHRDRSGFKASDDRAASRQAAAGPRLRSTKQP